MTKVLSFDGLSAAILGLVTAAALIGAGDSRTQLPCHFRDSINISSGTRDTQRNIFHSGIKYGPQNYALIDYDLEGYDVKVKTASYLRGCLCQVAKCVRLCCPVGEWFSSDAKCVVLNDSFRVSVNIESAEGIGVTNLLETNKFGFVHQKPCPGLLREDADDWFIDDTGAIRMMDVVFPQDEYCLAVEANASTAIPHVCPFFEEAKITYSLGIVLSIPFLVATLLIYACIPDLRNIHGKSLICYVLALTIAYVVLLLINFNIAIIPCNVQGYVLYFSVLVSFFWLNVMCFDIFWTFSSGVVIKNERKRFIYYSIYAWGSPMFILGLALLFDHTDLVEEEYRPRFGMEGCFIFHDKLVECLYFYLPLLLLVVANLYFFVVTAIRIIRIQHATDAALRNDSRRHSKFEKDRYRFSLYLRLFIVMGVTWTFEILSWAVGSNDWFFYLSDTCNCLLGVIIFFLFVWKQKVKQLVVKRIGYQRETSRTKSTSVNTASTTTKFSSIQESSLIPVHANA
ncbi:G-protein coupled receptor Mth2-like isoform X2 [Toxorhynchites rutilus septentrionalis]|uniref:G-protein coupled receptor Mth2-like isoform X2 n=1 Tax=Toxorhynchites rutilus septentrionalis TaxID=329112 RepID=UPI0024788DEE|nr:G-protein coupled receptor Mth2-like isoform X2 [Toxorhynchites rutilus septentrionalis]